MSVHIQAPVKDWVHKYTSQVMSKYQDRIRRNRTTRPCSTFCLCLDLSGGTGYDLLVRMSTREYILLQPLSMRVGFDSCLFHSGPQWCFRFQTRETIQENHMSHDRLMTWPTGSLAPLPLSSSSCNRNHMESRKSRCHYLTFTSLIIPCVRDRTRTGTMHRDKCTDHIIYHTPPSGHISHLTWPLRELRGARLR